MLKEDLEKNGEICDYIDQISKEFKKEFRVAMLEKKEKIMEAELGFIRKIKELIKKTADGPEEESRDEDEEEKK